MKQEDIINEFYDLEYFLILLIEEHKDEIVYKSKVLQVPVTLIETKVKLHSSQLEKLIQHKKPDKIPSFKYLEDYGIKFKTYYEIAIDIKSHLYGPYDDLGWAEKSLKFQIDQTQFEVGAISSLMVLLTEPIFAKSDYFHDEFHKFISVKMNIIDGKDYKSEFVKAIYYLNSHYFKSIDYFVTLNKLSIEIDEEFDYFDKDDPTKIFKSLKRTRHVVRKDLLKQEPLNLYNSAMNYEGESRFLLLYRVLEFFMNEALKKLSEKLRYDNSISSEELIIKLSIRDEEAQLQNLLSNVTSAKEKAKLSKFCKETELISLENFNKIGSKLYSFRNSIVHAKEKEIERTRFPNPFENNDEVRNWNNVLDLIARKSIMKLNM